MTGITPLSLFPLEIWQHKIISNISLEHREEVMRRLQRVCKTFYDLYRKNEYWNELLIDSYHHKGAPALAMKAFFKLKMRVPQKERLLALEKQLNDIALEIDRQYREHKELNTFLPKLTEQYRQCRWQIETANQNGAVLKQMSKSLVLPLAEKLAQDRKIPLLPSPPLRLIRQAYTSSIIHMDSGSLPPPASIKESQKSCKKLLWVIVGSIVFLACAFFNMYYTAVGRAHKSIPLS